MFYNNVRQHVRQGEAEEGGDLTTSAKWYTMRLRIDTLADVQKTQHGSFLFLLVFTNL